MNAHEISLWSHVYAGIAEATFANWFYDASDRRPQDEVTRTASAFAKEMADRAVDDLRARIAENRVTERNAIEIVHVGHDKIGVIKTVGAITGCGLKEGKDLIEKAMQSDRLIIVGPEKLRDAVRALTDAGAVVQEVVR